MPENITIDMSGKRLLDEFCNRLKIGLDGIVKNTPEPTTEEGDLYYTRMLEVLQYLSLNGIKVKI